MAVELASLSDMEICRHSGLGFKQTPEVDDALSSCYANLGTKRSKPSYPLVSLRPSTATMFHERQNSAKGGTRRVERHEG
jgi:hypothetical protein